MNPIVLHQKQKVEQDEQASGGNFSLFHLLAEWIEDIVKDVMTQRVTREIHVLCGDTLAKVMLEATKWRYPDISRLGAQTQKTEYGLTCTVCEINGELLPPAMQTRSEERIHRSGVPTGEAQVHTLQRALRALGIEGTPVQVTPKYLEGHARLMELKRRIQERS
mgnify:CR=1 FL=1